MPDYQPLDLSSFCTAEPELFGTESPAAVGEQVFHGLPFRVGAETDDGNRYIRFGSGERLKTDPVTIPLGQTARRVLFAHAALVTQIPDGGPVGVAVARHGLRYDGRAASGQPAREQF